MNELAAGSKRIFLIGYRGAGKSTVGPLLAERLGWNIADTDDEIISATGRTIADLFVEPGENGFREFESTALKKFAAQDEVVVATGGGIVLRAENRALITASGLPVWLRAPAHVLFQRIQSDPGTPLRRPHLIAGSSLNEVERLLPIREAHYRAIARLIVDTAGQSPEEVVSTILASC